MSCLVNWLRRRPTGRRQRSTCWVCPLFKRVVLKIKLYHTHFDWSVDRGEGPKAELVQKAT